MTEEYISGYLFCISRVKDIFTKYLGGFNAFSGFEKKMELTAKENLLSFFNNESSYYSLKEYNSEEIKSKIILTPVLNWESSLIPLIEEWTCDKTLESLNGKNGYYLSEYLLIILKDFFKGEQILLYKINSDDFPFWGDMSDVYLFESRDKFYVMNFGESS